VRVPRYVEQTSLEYLPGCLEVQAAGDTGRQPGEKIRFPHQRGRGATVTLGRDDGPPGTHLTLPAESVSRRHAQMEYENGRWKISNLSRTNPTVVNGEELMITEGARWLYDGDVIEMGELVFRFHER
jgi:FOG: FHA domain